METPVTTRLSFSSPSVTIGDYAGHPAIGRGDVAHIFRGVHHHPPGANGFGHIGNIIGQAIAAQMLLLDDEKIDSLALGNLSNSLGRSHVGGIDRLVHAETVENLLSLID